MRRVLLVGTLLGVLATLEVKAQQEAQFTHYMFNQLLYNSGYAGSRQGICASLLYRNQWSGFEVTGDLPSGGPPITQGFNIHAPIRLAQKVDLGVGGYFINDKEGFISTMEFKLAGAYRKKFRAFEMGIGFNAGFIQKSIDPEWKVPVEGRDDPRLPGSTSDMGFDAGLGLYLNSLNWYAGASAQHIPGTDLGWGNAAQYGVVPNYYITAGYNIRLGTNWQIQPSTLIKTSTTTTAVWDVSALALWKERIWAGLNGRSAQINVLSLMAGIYPLKEGNLRIGYSYDIATSQASVFGSTHEFFVNYCFKLNFQTEPPVWHKWPRDL